jgi:hypothetical protein
MRAGELFEKVLNYLRTGSLHVDGSREDVVKVRGGGGGGGTMQAVLLEAEFYGVAPLVAELTALLQAIHAERRMAERDCLRRRDMCEGPNLAKAADAGTRGAHARVFSLTEDF